jgi:hypothetical protein
MHRITASILYDFSAENGLEGMAVEKQFERMANYVIITPRVVEGYDLADVTTTDGDDGIDGCAVIVDEEVIVSPEDCDALLSDGRRNHTARLILTQAKTSEAIDLGDVLKFQDAVRRFCHDFDHHHGDPIIDNTKRVYAKLIDRAGSIRDGKPELVLRYIYTGRYQNPAEIERARDGLLACLSDEGYFADVDYLILDRDGLGKAFSQTTAPIEAKIEALSVAALPSIAGIEEAYLAVVPAKQFVENMLASEEGRLRVHVFEENVRAFLGAENPVNAAIADTISNTSTRSRFPVLNNGITVISPDVRVQGLSITFIDYQIINGCQTSNMLWLKRDELDEQMMVTLKVVETISEDVFSDLVKATNSQTKIDDDQFLSLQPVARSIEAYFNSFDETSEVKLCFERRDRQYVGQGIPGVKIFDLKLLARCLSAAFLQRPDLSYRFPRKIFSDPEISRRAFSPVNKEQAYYTACLIYYRMAILFSNQSLPPEARRFKWHMMALFTRNALSRAMPSISSRQVEAYCEELCRMIVESPDVCKTKLLEAYRVMENLGDLSDDRLKRQAVYEDAIQAAVE